MNDHRAAPRPGRPRLTPHSAVKLQDLTLLIFCAVIGVLAALGALLFRYLIEFFHQVIWPAGDTFTDMVRHAPAWLVVAAPAGAGLLAGPLITFLVPEARGPGVPEVIVSVTSRQSTIRHRVTLLKAAITSLLIGAGASVGREGPIVQIGASVGSSLAQLFRLRAENRRICLAAGAAAGIAATFNAPMAGTMFAIEIILLDIEVAHISQIVVAAVVGSVLSRLFWGDFPTFQVREFALDGSQELVPYVLLGVLAGLASMSFLRLLGLTDRLFTRVPVPIWLRPGLGGLLLGLLGLGLPQVLGVGYETVNMTLAGTLGLGTALLVFGGKALATSFCVSSGMSGGIFAPSLVLGATLGTALALATNLIFPDLALRADHFALVGMGGVVAGTTLAPITAILTIFELTSNYTVILPLMLVCIVSSVLVRLTFGYSIYEMKLLRRGVSIFRGHDVVLLRGLYARDFMSRDFGTLPVHAPFEEIMDAMMRSPYPHFVVLEGGGRLAGVISLRDLRPCLRNVPEKRSCTARDLMSRDVLTISELDNLEKALQLFDSRHISFLPVTEPGQGRVTGVLKKDDILRAYHEWVLKDRILSSATRPGRKAESQ